MKTMSIAAFAASHPTYKIQDLHPNHEGQSFLCVTAGSPFYEVGEVYLAKQDYKGYGLVDIEGELLHSGSSTFVCDAYIRPRYEAYVEEAERAAAETATQQAEDAMDEKPNFTQEIVDASSTLGQLIKNGISEGTTLICTEAYEPRSVWDAVFSTGIQYEVTNVGGYLGVQSENGNFQRGSLSKFLPMAEYNAILARRRVGSFFATHQRAFQMQNAMIDSLVQVDYSDVEQRILAEMDFSQPRKDMPNNGFVILSVDEGHTVYEAVERLVDEGYEGNVREVIGMWEGKLEISLILPARAYLEILDGSEFLQEQHSVLWVSACNKQYAELFLLEDGFLSGETENLGSMHTVDAVTAFDNGSFSYRPDVDGGTYWIAKRGNPDRVFDTTTVAPRAGLDLPVLSQGPADKSTPLV